MPTDLVKFVRSAKLATYAAQGGLASVAPLLPATKQLEFAEGEFLYRDIYAGMSFFVGQELVYRSTRPVWSMAYSGGLVVEATEAATTEIYRFLRSCLLQCPADTPLRGPARHLGGDLAYSLDVDGSFARFSAVEQIILAGSVVYRADFSGGAIQ